MPEQHVKLLQALGVEQPVIDEIENLSTEKVKDWKPDTAVAAIHTKVETGLLNNQEFLNKIPEDKVPEELRKKVEAGQMTRFQNEMKDVAMKKLGLEAKDFDDLSKNQKDSVIKAMTELIANKYLAKKGNVEGMQQMQQQVQKLTTDLETKDSEWQEKLKTQLEENNGKANARLIKVLTRAELATLDGITLNVKPGYITDALLAKLSANYAVVVTDDGELDIKQKNNIALDVLENNKKVTFSQALKKLVLEDKLGTDKKTEDGGGGKKKVIVDGGGADGGGDTVEVPSYIAAKINENGDAKKD